MSRLVNAPVQVEWDADARHPVSVLLPGQRRSAAILRRQHWREWIGILDGEPERDVWVVETEVGVCELHCLAYPTSNDPEPLGEGRGEWVLHRWVD